MSDKPDIRDSVQSDLAAIELLYPDAFPDEDLLPLVGDLLRDTAIAISLVAVIDLQIVGHGVFTRCGVLGSGIKAALLGPLVVAPDWQRQGIGSAIVRAGFKRLQEQDVTIVCVLGDPAYFRLHGFQREKSLKPPYPLPDEWKDAWQAKSLVEDAETCSGTLSLPAVWRKPALWAP
jgi:putative acetyltransferase